MADAVNVVVPNATPFTLKLAWLRPAGTFTLAGTVAVPAAAVERFTVSPPAGAGSVNCTVLCVCAPGATTMLLGSTNALPRTVTVDRPVASPSA